MIMLNKTFKKQSLFIPKKGLEPLLYFKELEPKPSMSTKFHHFGSVFYKPPHQ
jgi:hypothetical protein